MNDITTFLHGYQIYIDFNLFQFYLLQFYYIFNTFVLISIYFAIQFLD